MVRPVNNSPKIWLTTDTHFGHANMVKLCYRPENFDELIITNWKKQVAPDDVVIHLGDVAWYPQRYAEILKDLPGRKMLVRGNHDYKSLRWYMNNGFTFAGDELSMTYGGLDILFTHEPKIFHEHDINIHGHLHNNTIEFSEPFSAYYLVSLEKNGYVMEDLDALLPKLTGLVNDFKDRQGKYSGETV